MYTAKRLLKSMPVALLAEGVDRNNDELIDDKHHTRSPSSRRAWIEMAEETTYTDTMGSRPPRGGRG